MSEIITIGIDHGYAVMKRINSRITSIGTALRKWERRKRQSGPAPTFSEAANDE